MKQLIKSAIVYKADIGMSAEALAAKLEEHQFAECLPSQTVSFGFTGINPNIEESALVSNFSGGFAFRVRIDQKKIPAAAVKKKMGEYVASIKAHEDREVGKKERAEAKYAIILELAALTYPSTTEITCFYEQATGYLISPNTTTKTAGIITSLLVKAAGSVKTETIHVSSVKHGLTSRLQRWNDGDEDAFGVFQPCAEAALKQGDRKIGITMGDLQAANSAIKEAMASGFEVTSLGLTHNGETEFRLTEDFRLKGIEFAHTDAEDDEEPSFYAQATLEVKALSAVITDLIGMIGHGEGSEEAKEDDQEPTEERRVCNNAECEWEGPRSETYHYKNSTDAALCPECKETTEPVPKTGSAE